MPSDPRRLVLLGVVGGGIAALLAWTRPWAPEAAPLPARAPNFLIIAPDTLRADRDGAMRPAGSLTPNIDRLAMSGTRFTRMYSQSGWTLPALAALLSGRFPLAPIEVNGQALAFMRRDRDTLPELLSTAGYRTAVFWGPSISEAAPEFSRGFEHIGREDGSAPEQGVLAWLDEPSDRPFFALVHNVDLQFPTAAVEGVYTPSAAATTGMEPVYEELARAQGAAAATTLSLAYDAVVSRYDVAIGKMIDGLSARGLAGETVVILTSNHGIDLGEHQHYFHGTIYDTNLRVPLVISDPDVVTSGRTVDTVVQTVDLAPTILARAGLTPPHDLPGLSVLALTGGAGAYTPRDVYSLCSRTLLSVRSDRYKVAFVGGKGGSQQDLRLQVFDLEADPLEQRELRGAAPPAVQALVRGLEDFLAERVAEADRGGAPSVDTDGLKRALKENGYWGVATGTEVGMGGKPPASDGSKGPGPSSKP